MNLKRSAQKTLLAFRHQLAGLLPDSLYLKLVYKAIMGRKLDLTHPKTLNEKTQWLKLHDRDPKHITLVDKYAVREYVEKLIGKEYLIPLLGLWDRAEDIDFDILPNQFVLKPTHDSGSTIICTDKSTFDKVAAIKHLDKAIKRDFYKICREWPYKQVPRRIIAEAYIDDGNGSGLTDYKVFCFNGKAKCSFTGTGRFLPSGALMNYFDRDWNLMPLKRFHDNDPIVLPKPRTYEKMIAFAEKFAENEIFMRVDFYEVKEKLFFGEITLYPSGGYDKFEPESYDYLLGSWLKLPIDKE